MSDDKIAEIKKLERHLALVSERVRQLSEERDYAWAEVMKLRAEIERLSEVIRTIRARCVELDDSDAVSETLDIATAVLEDEPCA